MKKLILSVVLACATVVSYAQEQPTTQEKHVCTEQCDHSAQKETKACCTAASAEDKVCGKCHPKKDDKVVAVEPKKACCSESKACGSSK